MSKDVLSKGYGWASAVVEVPPPQTAVEPGNGEPPVPEQEKKRPRAWLVAYGLPDNLFSVVGESQIGVVKMVENLKREYYDRPGKFAPFQVLNHKSGGTDTAWLLPSEVIGVFHEYEYPEDHAIERGAMSKFLSDLEEATRGGGGGPIIVQGAPFTGEEEDLGGVVEVDPPTPTPEPDEDDGEGGSGGTAV